MKGQGAESSEVTAKDVAVLDRYNQDGVVHGHLEISLMSLPRIESLATKALKTMQSLTDYDIKNQEVI